MASVVCDSDALGAIDFAGTTNQRMPFNSVAKRCMARDATYRMYNRFFSVHNALTPRTGEGGGAGGERGC